MVQMALPPAEQEPNSLASPPIAPPLSRIAAENKEIVAIALPAVASALIDPILSLIDTAWVRAIGSKYALGAVAASTELFTMTFAASLALRESSSSTIARLTAAGRNRDAAQFSRRSVQIGLATGVLGRLLLASPRTAPFCVGLMGAHRGSPLFADALAYARVRALGLPFSLGCSAMEGAFRGLGNTRVALRASIASAFVNLIFDPLFIFAPLNLGVAGAAGATVFAQAVSFGVLASRLAPKLRQMSEEQQEEEAPERGGKPPEGAPPEPPLPEPPANALAAEPIAAAEATDTAATASAERSDTRALAGTTAATLLRTTSVLGCWVYIASAVSRIRGPLAIASHGVVLKVWLLFVLACDAPGVASQVLCTRRLASGDLAGGRALLLRMLRLAFALGCTAGLAVLLLAAPAAHFFFASDPALAASTVTLFRWAALNTLIVGPSVVCEAVLLGAGRSYKYLAGVTMANAVAVCALTRLALLRSSAPAAAWQCILLFFTLRGTAAAARIFLTERSGFGRWSRPWRRLRSLRAT